MRIRGNLARMLIFAVTIFAGAFLLFQVQPMIGKFILPWFGGGPGIWTSCMLFFQVVLLGGYAYAHFISRQFKPRTQVVVHLVLLGIALALLPITPSDAWRPHGDGDPRLKILLLLSGSVGVPYFALSATGPLIQQWFSRVRHGASPYRLYALSNAGSLLALLSYPFYFETQFSRKSQAGLWAWGLFAFVAACSFCAARVWKSAIQTPEPKADPTVDARGPSGDPTLAPGVRTSALDRALWLLLPATASVLLLATTNKVCQDVTVVPLLWVVPLSLYLLSFIISFDHPRWYQRVPFGVALALALAGVCWALLQGASLRISFQLGAYSAGLFVCCMVCHGELYRLRPVPAQLTGFYLTIAAGGALGGVFVTLVAPVIFTDYFELHWGLLLCAVLFLVIWLRSSGMGPFARWRGSAYVGSTIAIAALGAALWLHVHRSAKTVVHRSRNFYGVLAILKMDPSQSGLFASKFVHGITTHGLQLLDPALAVLPTTYFGENSGVGRVLRSRSTNPLRIGVVGLGAGTLATYARSGDYLRLYEINPEVERLARLHFTYLTNCPARTDVVLGDARLSLEREPPQNLDLFIIDAFSSDAIPMHLLTREAFALYQTHVKTNGVIAVHISNNHLDLEPVVANVAEHFKFRAVRIENKETRDKWWLTASIWMVLSQDQEIFRSPLIAASSRPARTDPENVPLWTDDFASLYPILRFQVPSDLKPKPVEAQLAIAGDLGQRGDFAGAIAHYRAALEINPDHVETLNNLAWLLASGPDPALRNGREAVQLAERACQLTEYRRTIFLGTLAAAYAEAGRLSDAVAMGERACALASESGDAVLLAKNRQLLEHYRAGKAYHEQRSQSVK